MTSTDALRLPEETASKGRHLAALEQRTFGEMVEVLTEEAMRQREFPELYFAAGPAGRRARFWRGPDVWEVLEPIRAEWPRSGRAEGKLPQS